MSSGETTRSAPVRQWLVEARVAPKLQENLDRLARSEDVRQVVVLPDVHLGRQVNNGCVAATLDLIYPQAVGSDLGCGLSAIGFHSTAEFLADNRHAQTVLSQLHRRVPALKQPGAQRLPDKLAQWGLSDASLLKASQRQLAGSSTTHDT